MVRKDKLLLKLRQNPKGVAFSDFESLLSMCGWVQKRQSGSHRLWYSRNGARLSIQPKGSKAKAYQVKQFLVIYDTEEKENS